MLPCSEFVTRNTPTLNTNRIGKKALYKFGAPAFYLFKNNTFPVELDP